jgi:hypothetical protein
VGGGNYNTASGTHSTVGGGEGNTASGDYSIAMGLEAVATVYGEEARSSGQFNTPGDAQTRRFILRRIITDVDSLLSVRGNATTDEIVISSESTWLYTIKVVGRHSADQMSFGFKLEGVIERTPLDTFLLGNTKTVIYRDNVNIDCNFRGDAFPGLQIELSNATNYYVVADVEIVQVSVPSTIPSYS